MAHLVSVGGSFRIRVVAHLVYVAGSLSLIAPCVLVLVLNQRVVDLDAESG